MGSAFHFLQIILRLWSDLKIKTTLVSLAELTNHIRIILLDAVWDIRPGPHHGNETKPTMKRLSELE